MSSAQLEEVKTKLLKILNPDQGLIRKQIIASIRELGLPGSINQVDTGLSQLRSSGKITSIRDPNSKRFQQLWFLTNEDEKNCSNNGHEGSSTSSL